MPCSFMGDGPLNTHRLHVASWYVHSAPSHDMVALLRPMDILYGYIEHLGYNFLCNDQSEAPLELRSILLASPEDIDPI